MTIAAPAASFDVFLSYNSRDAALVGRIAERLARAGLEPWLDRWCLTPGAPWQEELAAGLAGSASCAVFVGGSDLGEWSREELAVALDRAAKQRDFRLFLVLLPGLPEPFEAATLTPFLSTRTWVDFRRGVDDPRALQALINAIKGVPLGPEVPIRPRDDVSPYRGLQAFDEEHAGYFFGRDADIQRLEEKLKVDPFLAIIGPSGSGKSSLARAGLVPALRRGALPGSEHWRLVALRPGAHPLDVLAGQLLAAYPHIAAGPTRDQLAADPRTLRLVSSRPPEGGSRLLLLVDQCEEVFTLCRSEDERRLFLLNVLHAAAAEGPSVVVLTLRADFYPRLAAFPELAQHTAAHQFLVGPMSEEGLRQVIEEPARLAGLELESGLVDTMLEDVRHQPGALPLLEHALLELWRRRRGGMLTLEGYLESGGVAGALAKRADSILASFGPHEQAIARRVLLRLTQPGEGAEDTRRRAAMGELVTLPEDAGAVERVVHSLADARLLTTGGDEVEVAHEALIRGWPQLRSWVEEDRQGLRIHRRVTEAAEEWDSLDRDPGALYRGTRLAATREWAADHDSDLNALERDFLAASTDAEAAAAAADRRRARRLGTLAITLGVLLLVSVGLGLLALRSQREARRIGRSASSGSLAGQALTQMDRRLGLGSLLALEAYQKSPSVEARNAVVTAIQRADGLAAVASAGDTSLGALAVSPDGKLMAVSGGDQRATVITLFNVSPWRRLGEPLAGHDNDVLRLAISPDGGTLASSGEDDEVRLWELPSGKPIGKPIPSGHGTGLSFGHGLLAIGAGAGGPGLVDPASGDLRGQAVGTYLEPEALAFGGRPAVLASAGQDAPIQFWEVRGDRLVRYRPCPSAREAHDIWDLRFAPDGHTLAWAGVRGDVGLFDTRTCDIVSRNPSAHGSDVLTVRFNPAGDLLASGAVDGAKLWTVPDLKPAGRFGSTPVSGLAFVGRDRLTTAGGPGGTVKTWDLSGASDLRRPLDLGTIAEGQGVQAGLSASGRVLAVALRDGSVGLWDPRSRTSRGTLPTSRAEQVAVAPDGRAVAVVDKLGGLQVWDAASRRPRSPRVKLAQSAYALAFAPDGRTLGVVRGSDLAVEVRRTRDLALAEKPFHSHTSEASSIVFAPDGRLLVCDDDGTVEVWNARPRRYSGMSLSGCSFGPTVAVAPDGDTVAAGGDGVIALWDLRSGRQLGQRLAGLAGEVTSLGFSTSGHTLASASVTSDGKGELRLWDVEHRRGIGDPITGASWTGIGGNVLVTVERTGGTVLSPLLLNEDIEPFRRRICALNRRNLTQAEKEDFPADDAYEATC